MILVWSLSTEVAGLQPQLTAGWRHQHEADAEAVNCVDTSQHQAASDAGKSRSSQRIAGMNRPSAPMPELRTSPENEAEQDDRAARLDEFLARADQAARRIAAEQAERQASSDYAARNEPEAQTQAEAGHQVEAQDEVELELLCRGASALPDEPLIKLSIRATACAPLQHS